MKRVRELDSESILGYLFSMKTNKTTRKNLVAQGVLPRKPMWRSALLFLVVCLAGYTLGAQTRSPAFDQAAEIIYPVDFRADGAHPVLVFAPYTTGVSWAQAQAFGFDPGQQEDFILVLPRGRFQRQDYLPNFMNFISWFEAALLRDLRPLLSLPGVDPGRVYIAGHSLGGDLSWALSLRNPEIFTGAVMAGTRTSYPTQAAALERLRARGFRGVFLIGEQEIPARANGIRGARARFQENGVNHLFRTFPGAHILPPAGLIREALAYATAHEPSPSAGAPGGAPGTASGSRPGSSGQAAPPAVSQPPERAPVMDLESPSVAPPASAVSASLEEIQDIQGSGALDGRVDEGEYLNRLELGSMTLMYSESGGRFRLALMAQTRGWLYIGFGADTNLQSPLFMAVNRNRQPRLEEYRGSWVSHRRQEWPDVQGAVGVQEGQMVLELDLPASLVRRDGIRGRFPFFVAQGDDPGLTTLHRFRRSTVWQLD